MGDKVESITDLSEELAAEHGVKEPEMWGFLATLEEMGVSEATARNRAEREYGRGGPDG